MRENISVLKTSAVIMLSLPALLIVYGCLTTREGFLPMLSCVILAMFLVGIFKVLTSRY